MLEAVSPRMSPHHVGPFLFFYGSPLPRLFLSVVVPLSADRGRCWAAPQHLKDWTSNCSSPPQEDALLLVFWSKVYDFSWKWRFSHTLMSTCPSVYLSVSDTVRKQRCSPVRGKLSPKPVPLTILLSAKQNLTVILVLFLFFVFLLLLLGQYFNSLASLISNIKWLN